MGFGLGGTGYRARSLEPRSLHQGWASFRRPGPSGDRRDRVPGSAALGSLGGVFVPSAAFESSLLGASDFEKMSFQIQAHIHKAD